MRYTLARFPPEQAKTIFTFSDTWVTQDVPDSFLAIQSCLLFRKERSPHGGGVAPYVPSHMKVRRRQDLEQQNTEILWLEFYFKSKKTSLWHYLSSH